MSTTDVRRSGAVGGGPGVALRDPCFGYRVGPGQESVHADRRNPESICVVEQGHARAAADRLADLLLEIAA